jgi:acetylornithine/N-succinyldiaminopimelate aminotransferase
MDGTNELLVWYPGHELLLRDIVRAENCHLFDAAGRRYVDLESGVWCTAIGHAHPVVIRAMTEQAIRIAHTGFCYSNGVVEAAARELLALPGFDGGTCVLLCSGGEAVEHGVRTAQAVIGRPLLMTMADSYFGAYGSASRKQQDEWFSFDWAPCAACPHEDECGGGCEHWAAIPFDRIGGFLFEPGSSSGLVRFPPGKLVRNLATRIHDDGGLVLVNEVTTGVGRTGEWFGYQHYGIPPDIVATGKGLGNGYPVSAALYARGVHERLGGRPLKYAQSHQNDPLGAAVVRAVLRVIADGDLIARGRAVAAQLLSGLEEIRTLTDRIAAIRARGLMIAVELRDDPDAPFTIRVHRELVRRGYIVGRRPGVSVLRIDPALTIETADVEGFLATFAAVLADV